MRKTLLILFFFSTYVGAFIPPVQGILKEVTQGRKAKRPIVVSLRHRIEVGGGEAHEIEERIVEERGRYLFIWRAPGLNHTLSASLEKKEYVSGSNLLFSSRSRAFLDYFFASNGDQLERGLLEDGFIRRDQLMQFKTGFAPEGDPHLWESNANFLRHSDIALTRIDDEKVISVKGSEPEEPSQKLVYFDRKLQGIRRLEWKDGQSVSHWNFLQLMPISKVGTFPRQLSYESGGVTQVLSELVLIKSFTTKEINEFRNQWRQASNRDTIPSSMQNALRILLMHR